jgi:autophagy-related protein 2
LPLRLHVDQDALDFLTRFFEFKDDTVLIQAPKPEPPFFQRVEINSIQVKLDFKPKRVDYAGIRSGHTTEFMNFFILDRADMVLRHVILRGGISGFDKVGIMLNDIWMPDIKRHQLPGILAGLAPVRSLVNVGGGVRDLVTIPVREYRKDGRVVRSLQKGAVAFARTTTGELVKLGAKLAIGAQTVLQGAEDLLAQPSTDRSDVSGGWEDAELDEEEKKHISLYADQPIGVVQGLRGAYASLERDLLTAKDAIVAIPGEIMESGTAGGAAKAVLRGAPTVILRPAMGVSKAVGQTLMGATNSLDPGNRRRIEDVNFMLVAILWFIGADFETEIQTALSPSTISIALRRRFGLDLVGLGL